MKRFLLVLCILLAVTTVTACENISQGIDRVFKKEAPKAIVIDDKGEIKYYEQPSGTYAVTLMGIECKATFYPTTDIGKLKLYDKLSGEQIYEYRIAEGGKALHAKNTKTGVMQRFKYIYNDQFDTVKLDGILYTK